MKVYTKQFNGFQDLSKFIEDIQLEFDGKSKEGIYYQFSPVSLTNHSGYLILVYGIFDNNIELHG